MLLREGPKLWILEEMKLTDSLNFRYLSKVTPSRYVIELTENMQLYPVQHIVSVSTTQYCVLEFYLLHCYYYVYYVVIFISIN